MATVIINGQEIEIGDDERLNGIQAAERLGIEIPHYCWHPGLSVVASCRMCLVETGRATPETGEISMVPKLVPACQTPATDGTVFVTDSEKVEAARAMVEEDLLIRHPIDCPICDKAGECLLQDYHFQHGQDERRADIKPFTSRRRPVGRHGHAVRRSLRHVQPLRAVHPRGHRHRRVDGRQPRGPRRDRRVPRASPGQQAVRQRRRSVPGRGLGDNDFLYQQRVWFMKSARRRLRRLLDRLFDLRRGEPGPRLPAQAARESARQPVVDVRRGPLRLQARPRARRACRNRSIATTTGRPARAGMVANCPTSWTARLRGGRPPGGGPLAAPDGRGGLPAVPVRSRSSTPRRCLALGRCRWSARTRRFPTASRSAPRSVPTAAAWRRSSLGCTVS